MIMMSGDDSESDGVGAAAAAGGAKPTPRRPGAAAVGPVGLRELELEADGLRLREAGMRLDENALAEARRQAVPSLIRLHVSVFAGTLLRAHIGHAERVHSPLQRDRRAPR